jgi:hypothetical protein
MNAPMSPQQRSAMAGALGNGPMPPPGGAPPGMPPPGAGGPPPGGPPQGGGMPPDQAMQMLQSLGITPEMLPQVIEAITAVMQSGGPPGAGGPPPGAGGPPPGA